MNVFPDFFRAQLFATPALMTGSSIHVVYFNQYAAAESDSDTRYAGVRTLADLQNILGWGPPLPVSKTRPVSGTDTAGTNNVVLVNNPLLMHDDWVDTEVKVAVFIREGTVAGVANPIMFITDQIFGNHTLMRSGDSLAAVGGKLFAWPDPPGGATTTAPTVGRLTILEAPPDYEQSHMEHAWLYPQRVNMLANPSFELGTNHWRSSGSLTRIPGGAPGGGAWAGNVSGSGSAMVKGPFQLDAGNYVQTGHQFMDVPWVFKAKLALAALGDNGDLARHGLAAPKLAWRLAFNAGALKLYLSYDGVTEDAGLPPVFTSTELDAIANPDVTFYLGVQVLSQVGEVAYRGITSTNGADWSAATPMKTYNAGVNAVFVSTDKYQVSGGPAKVFWASLEAQDKLLWKFDPAQGYQRTRWLGPTGEGWDAAGATISGTAGSALVVESNMFPLYIAPSTSNGLWTVQAMVKGTGRVRVGLVSWMASFAQTGVDWGPETEVWTLSEGGFTQIYARRSVGDHSTGMVRIECDGSALVVDNMLCEPDWLENWTYFDGDTTYGALDDFSWYGGDEYQGASYSMWYNHRRAVVGRLFSWSIDDNDLVATDTEVNEQGFVYRWVPAGVRVTPHLDVLWQGDVRTPPPPVTGSVIPLQSSPVDLLGMPSAWALPVP